MASIDGKKVRNYGEIKVVCISFQWNITNFSLDNETVLYESPVFSADNNNQLQWHLQLYPKGTRDNADRYFSLYLKLARCNLTKIKTKFTLSVYDNEGEHQRTMNGIHEFATGDSAGFPRFLLRNFLQLVSSDCISIVCVISTESNSNISVSKAESKHNSVDNQLQVVEDLESLLESKAHSDLSFLVFGKKFHVHRTILAMRSPHLLKILENRLSGRTVGYNPAHELTDIDPEVMAEVLRFIYCGKVNNFNELAYDLLTAAEKYQLERLKIISEEALSNNITIDNALLLLTIADRQKAARLKKNTINFIIGHRVQIINTPEFNKWTEEQPKLLDEIFRTSILPK